MLYGNEVQLLSGIAIADTLHPCHTIVPLPGTQARPKFRPLGMLYGVPPWLDDLQTRPRTRRSLLLLNHRPVKDDTCQKGHGLQGFSWALPPSLAF